MDKLRLTRTDDPAIEWGGKQLKLNLSFDRVLLFFEYLEQEKPPAQDAAEMGLRLFLGKRAHEIPTAAQADAMNLIFELYIREPDPTPKQPGQPKAMDIVKDAPYIYAAFRQAYGIDLHQEFGRLSWSEFSALLQSIPAGTKLREIIGIRLRPIPPPNKHNAEEIAELRRLKQIYAIEQTGMSYQQGLEQLWAIAKARAKPE